MKHLRSRGLTLIELMICLAVGGVLVAIAAPNFQQAMNGNRLSSAASELIGAVQLARAEAIRNNRRVVLCGSADASSCATASSTWSGWMHLRRHRFQRSAWRDRAGHQGRQFRTQPASQVQRQRHRAG